MSLNSILKLIKQNLDKISVFEYYMGKRRDFTKNGKTSNRLILVPNTGKFEILMETV